MSRSAICEFPEFLGACRRMLRAAGRRVSAGDPEQLADLIALRNELDEVIAEAVHGLRSGAQPFSWADVARATGRSRQAAQMRWGKTA